jgi:hypothetical protein
MTEYIVYFKLPSGGYRVCFSKTKGTVSTGTIQLFKRTMER